MKRTKGGKKKKERNFDTVKNCVTVKEENL